MLRIFTVMLTLAALSAVAWGWHTPGASISQPSITYPDPEPEETFDTSTEYECTSTQSSDTDGDICGGSYPDTVTMYWTDNSDYGDFKWGDFIGTNVIYVTPGFEQWITLEVHATDDSNDADDSAWEIDTHDGAAEEASYNWGDPEADRGCLYDDANKSDSVVIHVE